MGKPWETLNERELIAFLTDRVEEGFVFPLNPVWMVRDGTNGWSELFEKMLANGASLLRGPRLRLPDCFADLSICPANASRAVLRTLARGSAEGATFS